MGDQKMLRKYFSIDLEFHGSGSYEHDALDKFLLETRCSSSTNTLLDPSLQILVQAAIGIASRLIQVKNTMQLGVVVVHRNKACQLHTSTVPYTGHGSSSSSEV
jgi:hypothetical protein